jgi:transcriptional regulator with XRE-family HTH domain
VRLGQLIHQYRIVREISLRSLAKQIGTSAPTLHRFESGRAVDADTLSLILLWCFGKVAQDA